MKNVGQWFFWGTLISVLFGLKVYSITPKTKLTMDEAQAIATKKVSGTVKSRELEHELGQEVYSFDILGNDKAIHEILVNANSGKIVSNKIESAAAEAKEATEDKK